MAQFKLTVGMDDLGIVEGSTYQAAARKAAKVVVKGEHRRLVARRVTGETEKSGMFQAYYEMGDALNSVGPNFHLRSLSQREVAAYKARVGEHITAPAASDYEGETSYLEYCDQEGIDPALDTSACAYKETCEDGDAGVKHCNHNNIRVYTEVTYAARLLHGVVVYDDSSPDNEEVKEAICLGCDKVFTSIETAVDSRGRE